MKLLTEMSGPERDAKSQHDGFAFFSTVKDMTVEGFYTSKIGLIDVLDYQGMNYMRRFSGMHASGAPDNESVSNCAELKQA